MNRLFIVLSLTICLGLSQASAQSLFKHVPTDKIDGEVVAHRLDKQRLAAKYANKSTTEFHKAFLEKGLNPAQLDAEDCAIYVDQPLPAAEIAKLSAQGIQIHPTYVPPVSGRHPYGFYLATVQYSALDAIRADARFVRLASTEFASYPVNDQSAIVTNVDDLHAGIGNDPRNGVGVLIAIADSGIDLTHNDFPVPVEAYDMTDGVGIANWGLDVANTVTDHGTHVTGIALGRGTDSSGTYVGAAPGANLAFYKIGNDTTAGASIANEVQAITRALEIGADIFSLSYGGTTEFMDGSQAHCQAIDVAVAAGMVVFVSAGNSADDREHDSVSLAPGATSASIGFSITNPSGSSIYDSEEWIRVIWLDDTPGDANISLVCTNLGTSESLTMEFSASSPRGTDARRYVLTPSIPASSSKTYTFELSNTAGSGTTPLVHLYQVQGSGEFDDPDPTFTVTAPALADSAIAVGAHVHRTDWTNFQNNPFTISGSQTLGTRANFSSRGPRVDGSMKPQLLAPGATSISTSDSNFPPSNTNRIDNDGLNQNGSGPATYRVMSGTSMACPWTAGVAALLLEERPTADPGEILTALSTTASLANAPTSDNGYGLIDALAAATIVVPVELAEFTLE